MAYAAGLIQVGVAEREEVEAHVFDLYQAS
jgi:hypothetical protein